MSSLKHDVLAARLQRQNEEAHGADNRLFFFEHHGREPVDDDELMMYYIEHGGAEGFKLRLDEKEARAMEADREAQRQEALSAFNMWVTGEAVRHPPSSEEAEQHYNGHGGPEGFRDRKRLSILTPKPSPG